MITRAEKKELLRQIRSHGATPFQKKVWRTILAIPTGQVRSYEWVARKIGHPRAARGVGLALKKNPFAPDVPCHRVIRKDGSLGGYSGRGGIKGKEKLLKREKGSLLRLQ